MKEGQEKVCVPTITVRTTFTSTKVEEIVPEPWSVASRQRRDSYAFVTKESFDKLAQVSHQIFLPAVETDAISFLHQVQSR